MDKRNRIVRHVMAVVVLLACVSCRRGTAWMERWERERPVMQRALVRLNNGDTKGAMQLYYAAIDQDPTLAKAHLDLALLLHDFEQDYVGAIYHYRTYLRLRPDTEKKSLIEERLRLATQLFAASMGQTSAVPKPAAAPGAPAAPRPEPSSPQVQELRKKVSQLEDDKRETQEALQEAQSRNRLLESDVSRLRTELAFATSRAVERAMPAMTAAPVVPDEPPVAMTAEPAPTPLENDDGQQQLRTYRVKRGDTLSSIAQKLYGDVTGWEKLYSANKEILKSGTRLQVGQVLVIP